MACTCWPIGVLELKVLLFTFRALGPASGRFVRVCAITCRGSYKYLYFHIPEHPTLLSRPLSSTHIVPFNATLKGTLFYLPIGPKVIPFWGSYLEFYKVIPKRNYFGAWYLVIRSPLPDFIAGTGWLPCGRGAPWTPRWSGRGKGSVSLGSRV